ncbi:membrane bound O-acyl transferase family-domain-containing protein [Melanogaster broomeanus]|nr:membrane bound O-acyl transferase family-domain-containing protein [Melanogaster broomeanus]
MKQMPRFEHCGSDGTQVYRVALLPIVWFTWRASVSVDLSGGDPARAQLHAVHVRQCVPLWATAQEPYRRIPIDGKLSSESQGSRDKEDSGSTATALWNAWDLLLNVRGIGWNWSRGPILPKPVFETHSRTAFVLWSAVRFAFHFLAYDATAPIIRMTSPENFTSVTGASTYDPSLPPVWQLLRCVTISTLVMLMACFATESCHILLAVLFVTVFQQHPSQWPPLFDSPWLSTSLNDFWGRRWHQMIRHILLMAAGRPFNVLFGRRGGVLGVFLLSGLVHDVDHRPFGRGGNFVIVVGFFTMNGVGVVLERVWKRLVCTVPSRDNIRVAMATKRRMLDGDIPILIPSNSQLIQQAHSPASARSSDTQCRLQQELFDIQKRFEAWGLVKVARDWDTFPHENAPSLRDFLLEMTLHSIVSGKTKVVLRKLLPLALKIAPGTASVYRGSLHLWLADFTLGGSGSICASMWSTASSPLHILEKFKHFAISPTLTQAVLVLEQLPGFDAARLTQNYDLLARRLGGCVACAQRGAGPVIE